MEFPDSPEVYNISSEFMIGDSILFAPKSERSLLTPFHLQKVNFYLPSGSWYNYQTKLQEIRTNEWQLKACHDHEQVLFVRGGAILPIL